MAHDVGHTRNPQNVTRMRKSPDCTESLTRAEIHRQLRDCAEQIRYWTMRKAQAALREDRLRAAALLLAWQSNQRCQFAALAALSGKAAA